MRRGQISFGRFPWLACLIGIAGPLACNAVSGIGDYEFGAAGATATPSGSGGTGGSGGAGNASSTGGAAGSVQTGGGGTTGSGGSGGSGGSAPTLVDRGLVVRYHVDEAGSGQGPSELIDAAPSPLNLAMTYSPELSFTSASSNRGLVWTAAGSQGDGRVSIGGTKFHNSLHGSTAATIEAVVDVSAVGTAGNWHITTVGPGGNAGDLSLHLTGATSVRLSWRSATNIGTWNVPITTVGRVVLHAVLDTTEPTATMRTRLYVDGQTAGASSGTPPTLNDTVDLSASTAFVLGNGVGSTTLSIGGTIFYVAYYSSALSAQEVATNTALLLSSDDSPP